MHHLLRHVENISSCRDREALNVHLVCGLFEVARGGEVMLLASETGSAAGAFTAVIRVDAGGQVDTGGHVLDAASMARLAPLVTRAQKGGEALIEDAGGRMLGVFPLRSGGSARFLVVATDAVPSADDVEAMAWLVRIYGNYIGLLDYSEFDSLTNLLNRKTFDEAFDRMLARAAPPPPTVAAERRNGRAAEGGESWLAVVDVDHFKRVNDTFGHLFGDEVLLRVAGLMRASFRDQDRLFRFGGEEFVVMLHVQRQEDAAVAVDRFRAKVAAYEFPQVGHVTLSAGMTRVDAAMAPSDVLGRADEALYFAKASGRNQIHCYEDLLAAGKIAAPTSTQPADIDIDALFD